MSDTITNKDKKNDTTIVFKPSMKIIAHTPDPEKVITTAAKLCYSPNRPTNIMENLTDKEVEEFLNMIMKLGHGSILEHVTFTFAIEGLSRISEIQLLRKRTASPSVQSGRYVFRKNAEYYIPKSLIDSGDMEAIEFYINSVTRSQSDYLELTDMLVERGMDLKMAIEKARGLQAQSVCTNLLFTIDLRNLIDLIKLRKCKRAQEEIVSLAIMMEKEVKKLLPTIGKFIGAPCEFGKCSEGKMSCKNPYIKLVE